MSDMLARMQAFNTAKRQQFERIMRCEESPPVCFTCAMRAKRSGGTASPATYVTATITPAGYHAWQCDDHRPTTMEKPWGADPGWPSAYLPLADARSAFLAREARA